MDTMASSPMMWIMDVIQQMSVQFSLSVDGRAVRQVAGTMDRRRASAEVNRQIQRQIIVYPEHLMDRCMNATLHRIHAEYTSQSVC